MSPGQQHASSLSSRKAMPEALLRAGFGEEEGFLHAFFAQGIFPVYPTHILWRASFILP